MKTDEIKDNIDQYCLHFKEHLEKIGKVSSFLYQKILLVALLDTLSLAKYPEAEKNKDRFLKFITECSDWNDCNRVSLPMLSYRLGKDTQTSEGALAKEVTARLGKWQYGRVYRLKDDPLIEEIASFANGKKEEKIVKDSKHAALLYDYRNNLVHEFRKPGRGMETRKDGASPCYHSVMDEDDRYTWELVYPIGLFKAIARRSLVSLRRYLLSNNLDPYSFYKFDSPWKSRDPNRGRSRRPPGRP